MAQQQERQRVPVGANQIWVSTAASVYHRTHRERVNEEILANNPDLARRLNNEEDDDLRQIASYELFQLSHKMLQEEFENLSESEKAVYQRKSEEDKYNQWRALRREGRLIENEESLAQKAEDDKLIAMGLTPGENNKIRHNADDSAMTSKKNETLTPPFCKSVFGVIENDEDYF